MCIGDRVDRVPLVVAFTGSYFLLFTATAVVGNPAHAAEIFRPPDAQAALFFASFILTDPPTSPMRYSDLVVGAVLVAVSSYAAFMLPGAAHYLLAGDLVGNVWGAGRRARAWRQRSVAARTRGRESESRPLRRAGPGVRP